MEIEAQDIRKAILNIYKRFQDNNINSMPNLIAAIIEKVNDFEKEKLDELDEWADKEQLKQGLKFNIKE